MIIILKQYTDLHKNVGLTDDSHVSEDQSLELLNEMMP